MAGNKNILADTLNHCLNYNVIEMQLVEGSRVQYIAVDIILDDCFKVLLRRCPAAEQGYPFCSKTLPYEDF